ncbi:N-formylglutamate amidohydrolase [Planctomycetes bacterium K23_9]|uniref:N-formylglutamate amidohydrolase n=1 Tax=Stieleria marina TaxID=1930275 RepID=A0A517P104_9BACT|nr:N-formylglutamate amidohydrolase [Planctomycetes bacterium K23_9]
MCILISCESGGANLPAQLLRSHPSANETDSPHPESTANEAVTANKKLSGNADVAAQYASRRMSERLGAPLMQYQYSLDAIDVTRSLRHPKLFSKDARKLSADDRQQLINDYYLPYRSAVKHSLRQMMRRHRYVVHLSVRTFDLLGPKQKRRRADVGLLYDPACDDESDLSADWAEELYFEADMLKIRRNYPRRGTVESLTKAMRSEFQGQQTGPARNTNQTYLGIEILLNRAWAGRAIQVRDTAIDQLCDTLRAALQLQQSEAA